ncbi:cupin [Sphaerisporangium melleum]|uniref:Cupin n=1 Tax=Sphaerisporangium melleum TaxID=321316 RepID=A0A917QVG6_9ACTN|nr:cupin domain-containing protein [Sphaerisporangium melleum]GGK69696.1 cupin [Sphaerisporangium melleum]GII69054.1 cupin [Sphaerisporangium melleum]
MRKLYRIGLAAIAAGLVMVPQAANATPGTGVTAKVLAEYTTGNTHFINREITIAPGGSTGWHYHEGNLYGVVIQGTLSHFNSRCKSDGVYRTGKQIVEPAGRKNVHIGKNLGKTPVILNVTYVLPVGAEPAVDVPEAPRCDAR